MKDVKHYLKNGTEYKGAIHKHEGLAMTGRTHTESSNYLSHSAKPTTKPKKKKTKPSY